MEDNTSKTLWSLIFLVILGILAANLLFFSAKKQKEAEIIHQEISAQEQAQKKAKEVQEKIYLMGKFNPAERENFILIPKEYNANENAMYLRKETFYAFLEMKKTAEEDGVNLKIASATRNFDYQKNIWNNKWDGVITIDKKKLNTSIPDGLERFKKILEYSAAPGTSRHHWGTEIDINDANPEYFETKEGIKVYDWLNQNAYFFGFCQPYNLKGNDRATGYNEEKWHWSFLPLAKTFTQEYQGLIKNEDISDFLGEEYVPQLNLINDYVLGINPECL